MKIRSQQPVAGPVDDIVARWLLGSFSAVGEKFQALPEPVRDQIFDLFTNRAAGAFALFAEHREYLRARAVEWGIEPHWRDTTGRTYFYYEPRDGRIVVSI